MKFYKVHPPSSMKDISASQPHGGADNDKAKNSKELGEKFKVVPIKDGIYKEYIKNGDDDHDGDHLMEASYRNGERHGFYRIFTNDLTQVGEKEFSQFHSLGYFINGKNVGISWSWLEGNGYMIDFAAEEYNNNNPRNAIYIYPSLTCGIFGKQNERGLFVTLLNSL